jgi:hypothetical protein
MNSMWLDVDLRTETKETCVQKRMEYDADSQQHDKGGIYDHLIMSMIIFTLILNKIFI